MFGGRRRVLLLVLLEPALKLLVDQRVCVRRVPVLVLVPPAGQRRAAGRRVHTVAGGLVRARRKRWPNTTRASPPTPLSRPPPQPQPPLSTPGTPLHFWKNNNETYVLVQHRVVLRYQYRQITILISTNYSTVRKNIFNKNMLHYEGKCYLKIQITIILT